MPKEIRLTTEDDVELKGSLFEPEDKNGKGVIFFHMLRKERSVWNNLGNKLAEKGYSSASIDLRGHGESDGSWQGFSEDDFQDMIYDAKAAKDFLRERISEPKLAYVGASIGANLALIESYKSGDIQACVLLSPGLSFHGLRVESIASDFSLPFLLVASEDDYYAYNSSETLKESFCSPEDKSRFIKLKEGGHGTNMFEVRPEIQTEVVKWLEEIV